jgi:hypothetical protein
MSAIPVTIGRLPETPWAVEIELELTNVCNASCVACPRGDMPAHGRMTRATVDRILDRYDVVRARHPLNLRRGGLDYPYVTLAGGGEPLIHPQATGFIRHIVERGYRVHLISNCSALTERRLDELIDSGVSSVACSFWGVTKAEYERAMHLPYERSLRWVERLAERAAAAGIELCVTWVRSAAITSSDEDIARFWAERGIPVDMSDNYMWNRGGLNPLPLDPAADDVLKLPDFARDVWCADLYFSDTWSWDGRALLCCCNYFTSGRYEIGDAHTDGVGDLSQRKAELLGARPAPAMCQVCRQPRTQQSRWLAEPWRPYLSDEQWNRLTYADKPGPAAGRDVTPG